MELVCVGVNHKLCPVEIRERLAFSESEAARALRRLKETGETREAFLLSTCNRVELYGRGSQAIETFLLRFLCEFHGIDCTALESFVYVRRGREAVHHLFRVASGLDSLVVGENEIYGQVRRAFRLANDMKTLESVLYQVVERAIRVGKRVRAETQISDGATSVSAIAVELAEKIFGRLTNEQVLVLGTGKMSEKTLRHLVQDGAGSVFVASRSYERALETAGRFGARPIVFSEWMKVLAKSDIVISSTASPQPIVTPEEVSQAMRERRHKPLCLIDIAVPRDVDPRVGEIEGVYLYNIDDLKGVAEANLRRRKKEIEKCERLIEHELALFDQWREYLEAKPVIERLTSYFDRVAAGEFDKVKHRFKGKEAELETLLSRIKANLLARPLEKLKESAAHGALERYLETLHSLFHLETSGGQNGNVNAPPDVGARHACLPVRQAAPLQGGMKPGVAESPNIPSFPKVGEGGEL